MSDPKNPPCHVVMVDGEVLRDNIDPGFIGGTNHHANPEYCPAATVLLEKGFSNRDLLSFLVHELSEDGDMAEGEDYSEAHGHANANEGEFRDLSKAAAVVPGAAPRPVWPQVKAVGSHLGQHFLPYALIPASTIAAGGALATEFSPERRAASDAAMAHGATKAFLEAMNPSEGGTIGDVATAGIKGTFKGINRGVEAGARNSWRDAQRWVTENPWQTGGLAALALGAPVALNAGLNALTPQGDRAKRLRRAKERLELDRVRLAEKQLAKEAQVPWRGALKTLAPTAIGTAAGAGASHLAGGDAPTTATTGAVTGGMTALLHGLVARGHKIPLAIRAPMYVGVAASTPAAITTGIRGVQAVRTPGTTAEFLTQPAPVLSQKINETLSENIRSPETRAAISDAANTGLRDILMYPVKEPGNFALGVAGSVATTYLGNKLYDLLAKSKEKKQRDAALKELVATKTEGDAVKVAGVGKALGKIWSHPVGKGALMAGPTAAVGYEAWHGIAPEQASEALGYAGGRLGVGIGKLVAPSYIENTKETVRDVVANAPREALTATNQAVIPARNELAQWVQDHKWGAAGGLAALLSAPIALNAARGEKQRVQSEAVEEASTEAAERIEKKLKKKAALDEFLIDELAA